MPGREARIDLHAQGLGLLTEPAAQISEADDVVAVVVHVARDKGVGGLARTVFTQEIDVIPGHGRIQRRTTLFPVRKQLIQAGGLKYGPGDDVRPDLSTFLNDTDGEFLFRLIGELLDATGRGEACGARTDDQNIKLHRFTFHDNLLRLMKMQSAILTNAS